MKQTDQPQDVRSLKELYQLVLSSLINYTYNQYFICNIINGCLNTNRIGVQAKITNKESKILLLHFKSQKPTETLYPEIYNTNIYQKNRNVLAWFTTEYGATEQDMVDIRVKLIHQIITAL